MCMLYEIRGELTLYHLYIMECYNALHSYDVSAFYSYKMKKSCSVFVLLSVLCIIMSSASSWHPLLKRQDQGGMCSVEAFAGRICTNGFYEDYAYIVAQCNQAEAAQNIRDVICRTNENGVVCGILDTSADFAQFRSVCGSSPTTSTCSDECRSFLTAIRARYGCCVNVLNTTEQPIVFSYSLWSRCGVDPVTEECTPSSFTIPAEIDPTCTDGVLLEERLYSRVLCRTEFINDLRDFGASCGQNSDPFDLVDSSDCAADENGN